MADQPLNRRQVLGFGAAAVAATVLVPAGEVSAARAATGPRAIVRATDGIRPLIRPRSDWAGDLRVTGELVAEDDVRFLLVHHTASTNDYRPEDVVGQIRGFYNFHTGPEKGWPDVAYNFFVDRYGGIWEGRAGSIDGPVRGDATGGSQGFALLCSLIGNFSDVPVPTEQQDSLVELLAWLGESYALDTAPGALTTFVSRGSSRWPAGDEVTASTISGHRDMSTTSCPGDLAYSLITGDLPARVSAVRRIATDNADTSTTSTSSADTSTSSTSPADTSTSAADSTSDPETAAEAGPDAGDDAGPDVGDEAAPSLRSEEQGDGNDSWRLVVGGGVLGALAAAGGLFSRLWKRADDID